MHIVKIMKVVMYLLLVINMFAYTVYRFVPSLHDEHYNANQTELLLAIYTVGFIVIYTRKDF